MDKILVALFAIGGAFTAILIFCALFALPVMWLWNGCLVGAVDGVHDIGFWQALGLLVLSSIMFKNNTKKD